jgi:hypothetical protein
MNLKDMIIQVVYINHDGLSLLKIVEEVNNRYHAHVTTLEVDQVVRKNPKLFVEVGGKIKSPTHL